MELELNEYNRKTFTVKAVEVTFKNVEALAKWCGGKVDSESSRILGGANADLPIIKLQGQGEDRGKELIARLGYFIVESKKRFRVYKAPQFYAAFEEKVVWQSNDHESDCQKQHQGEGCVCDLQEENTVGGWLPPSSTDLDDAAEADQEHEDALHNAGQL